jgi:hypothetical protein
MIGIRTLLCAASAACGLALGINASAATLSLSIDACDSFSIANNVITCNTSGGAGPVASCSLSPTNSTVAIGTNKVVTMSCSNMAGTPQITWGGCTSSNGSTCTVNLATPDTTVTVTATANDGTNNISKSTTVTSFDPNAGGGGVPTTCSDGTKVVPGPTIRNFDSQPVFVSLPNKQTAVFPIVIPSSGQFQLRYFQAGDSSDGTARQAFIAKTACDMKNNRSVGSYPQQQYSFGTSTGGLSGVVDGQSIVSFGALGNVLHGKPGDTWYLMVQNKNSRGTDSCSTGACALYITPSSSN